MAVSSIFFDELLKLQKATGDVVAKGRGDIVSTGILGLDLITHGGVNMGSIHEMYGKSKTAKSLLLILIARELQRKYPFAVVVILDGENAHPPDRLESFGLDMNRTIPIPSRMIPTVDSAYDMMIDMIAKIEAASTAQIQADASAKKKSKNAKATPEDVPTDPTLAPAKGKKTAPAFGRRLLKASPQIIFLIDSLPSFAESMDYVEDMGRRAKAWHQTFRRLTGVLDPKLMVCVSNQITYKPTTYGDGETKSTGVALDYYRDCGISLSPMGDIFNDSGIKIGIWIKAVVPKTRRGPMYGETFFPVLYRPQPVDYYSGILPYCQYLGIAELSNKTAWKDKGGKSDVWPNYKCCGKPINERDPEALKAFVKEHSLLQVIADRQKEVYGVSYEPTAD